MSKVDVTTHHGLKSMMSYRWQTEEKTQMLNMFFVQKQRPAQKLSKEINCGRLHSSGRVVVVVVDQCGLGAEVVN